MIRGFDISWRDLEGDGGFDFLARRDSFEFEVECKVFSGDIGRKIHSRRQYQLGGLIYKTIWKKLGQRDTLFVDIALPRRLSGSDLEPIAHQVRRVLDTDEAALGPEPCAVRLHAFDRAASPFANFGQHAEFVYSQTENFVLERFDCVCRHFLVIGNSKKVALVGLRTNGDDDVVKGIYRSLKSGSQQLSGSRPGVLCAQLQDVRGDQLADMAQLRGNGLQLAATRLFENEERAHLHSVVFFAPGSTRPVAEVREGQAVGRSFVDHNLCYVFRNNRNPSVDDDRLLVFGVG